MGPDATGTLEERAIGESRFLCTPETPTQPRWADAEMIGVCLMIKVDNCR